ncbi:MAG: hypothetical protein KDJ29_11195 [Hyphomicrobiales bacterium]|nr:hypothetical protein [Hyphomicrobiales bacterium]
MAAGIAITLAAALMQDNIKVHASMNCSDLRATATYTRKLRHVIGDYAVFGYARRIQTAKWDIHGKTVKFDIFNKMNT